MTLFQNITRLLSPSRFFGLELVILIFQQSAQVERHNWMKQTLESNK